ncbi:hypothetical protein K2173_017675 [Erythroxylum novogranatense]|uniref:Reverse transcriptase Ty1/copia-type domain-containing protein n=1 Tax=Erythroxylum novogranatense TaxID=1862640 RepID=A0AAV8SLJ6_9ROSI|nr:hypothetical protein K2173_017675 [Erythroxylum novogranatense]
MDEEIKAIEDNETWILMDLPSAETKVVDSKWIFKEKLNPDGSINKYKARLVVRGYKQEYGVDYTETYAPVTRLDTVRMLLALAASKGWRVHQMDVKRTNDKFVSEFKDSMKSEFQMTDLGEMGYFLGLEIQ